jgi:hypothetical protein
MDETDCNDARETIRADEIVGNVFAVSAGLLLLMTFCGWLVIFSGLNTLNKRHDDVRVERYTQHSDVKGTVREKDEKLGTLVEKLQRVEEMTLGNIDGSDSRTRLRRLESLEQQMLRLRDRANNGDVAHEAPACDQPALEKPSAQPSHKENGDDRRE